MNKIYPSVETAVADIPDGATIMVGGFGSAGVPEALVRALAARPVRDLVLVSNGTGEGESGLVHLIRNRQVRRVLTSFPAPGRSPDFEAQYNAGALELELVPQGTLAERASPPSIPPRRSARRWRRARSCGRSTDAPICWSTPSRRTSGSSAASAPTPGATSSTARPRATSTP